MTAEPEQLLSPSERLLREHLAGGRFQTGVDAGHWRLVEDPGWPHLIIAVRAAPRSGSSDEFFLYFDLTDYPTRAPTAMPWDPETRAKLEPTKRPQGDVVGLAFRSNWEGGRALYVAYDRVALESHSDWPRQNPTQVWDATKKISFYLRQVHELLNSSDYQGI